MNNEIKLWEGLLAEAWLATVYTEAQVFKTAVEHGLDFDEVKALRDEMAGL